MKKLITVAFMAFLSLVSYAQDDWANFGRYEQDNREVKTTPNDAGYAIMEPLILQAIRKIVKVK